MKEVHHAGRDGQVLDDMEAIYGGLPAARAPNSA
jgi:hypothetical protein